MGGLVKGAFGIVKSVAKFAVNMVKSVIQNPLPTILTIGLNFAAPGIASALGFVKPLSSLTGVVGSAQSLGTTIVQAVGRAAISAATGGSLSNIVAAGITPFLNSKPFQETLLGLGGGSAGEALNKVKNFVQTPLTQVFGKEWGSIFTGALGESSMAGVVAAISGNDIASAMGSELATSVVGTALSKAWNTLKTEVPKLLQSETDIEQKALNAKIMKDTTPIIGKVESLQGSINKNITEANSFIDEYNKIDELRSIAAENANYYAELANNATTQEDFDFNAAQFKKYEAESLGYIPQLDHIANTLNQLYIPSINNEKALLEAEYNANKSVIDDYISRVDEVGQLSKDYELGLGKVLAENADFRMMNAIAQGDFTEASKIYNEFEGINKHLLDIDPNAITVAPSIDLNAQTLLKDIYSAADETLKNQLIAQANLNQQFNDIKTQVEQIPSIPTPVTPTTPQTPAPVQPTPEEPSQTHVEFALPETPAPVDPTKPHVEFALPETITETPEPVEQTPVTPVVPETPPTDDRAPGYAELPTLPEEGIGQPAPPAPTTPPSGTGSSTIGNIVSGVGNVAGNVLQNALIGAGTNAIVNEILGNEPPQRPNITKPRPPAKVDVSTLRPYTGSMFGTPTTTPTTPITPITPTTPTAPPAKVDPSTLTPYTGSLGFLDQTTTPPTNTATQTPSGGLQSTQTQTPPTKVDVSKLTPVTDTNLLTSLGIV